MTYLLIGNIGCNGSMLGKNLNRDNEYRKWAMSDMFWIRLGKNKPT